MPREDLDSFVDELVRISKRTASGDGSGFVGQGRQDCRRVGEAINGAFGFDGMTYVCTMVAEKLGRAACRELEYAWDGIGKWMG